MRNFNCCHSAAWMLLVLLIAFCPFKSQAQWEDHSGDLPGLISYGKMLRFAGLGTSGLVAGIVFFPKPQMEFQVKSRDFKRGNFSPKMLDSLEHPVVIHQKGVAHYVKGPFVGVYRRTRSDGNMVFDGRKDSLVVPVKSLRGLSDLRSGAKLARCGRMRVGMTYTGLAISELYEATFYEHGLESDSRVMSWLLFAAYGGLATHSFLLQSKAEKEMKIWTEEYGYFPGRNIDRFTIDTTRMKKNTNQQDSNERLWSIPSISLFGSSKKFGVDLFTFNRPFSKIPLSFMNRTMYTIDRETKLATPNLRQFLAYNFKNGVGVGIGSRVESRNFLPSAGVQYLYNLKNFGLLAHGSLDLKSDKNNMVLFGAIARYHGPIAGSNNRFFGQLELDNHLNFTTKYTNAVQRLWLGISLKNFQVGLFGETNQSARDKETGEKGKAAGVFARMEY